MKTATSVYVVGLSIGIVFINGSDVVGTMNA